MSIYATNFIIDEDGNKKLVKHLNQQRIDRNCGNTPGGWNKTGKKIRMRNSSKKSDLKQYFQYLKQKGDERF